ncbi:MAG: hypothetical protein RMJ19_03965 [Gemmatales bacterium]|nr:hypothetical protein [Gemmatales bacterium]MDW8174802.1 hypothetical protein [Gemmatales bacterium]
MPEEFYTLQQAAARLGLPPERLRQMVQRNEIRFFMDRGEPMFRKSDVEEISKRLGLKSDASTGPPTPKPSPAPEVKSSEDSGPRSSKPAASPSAPESPSGRETMPAGLDAVPFEIADGPGTVDLASVFEQGPRTPGTDSDVRLVPDGSDINVVVFPPDADKPLSQPSSGKDKPESQVRLEPGQPAAEAQRPRLSQLDVRSGDSDSDVRLVDVDGPQIVPTTGAARHDSRIRLEPDHRSDVKSDSGVKAEPRSPEGSDSTLQLEVNLDEELQGAEEQRRRVSDSSEERAAAEMLQDPVERTEFEGQGDEFELSLPEDETALAEEGEGSATFRIKEESEDVSRSPAADSSSNQPLTLDGGEASATEELSFDLSLQEEEATEVTPRPESAKRTPDSSSEFELSVQEDDDAESDTALLTSQGKKGGRSLQEADTEMEETSDFDLQLVEEEAPVGEESGRETEVIIDEAAGSDQETQVVEPVEDLSDLDLGPEGGLEFAEPGSSEVTEVEEEAAVVPAEETAAAIRYVELAPADWGLWALVHVPTTLVLIFVGLLMFELVRSVLYYHEPSMMGGQLFELLANLFRK